MAAASTGGRRWLLWALLLWTFALRAVFAASGLEPGRFYDERYTLANVHALLTPGESWPANAFYPSLAYLPQTALLAAAEGLHRATGAETLAVLKPDGETFTPLAYYLCRLLQAVYGTLSVLLTFLAGRRVFGPAAGLLGAFLLAVVPDHLRLSVYFKPDILLTLLALAVFLWSLDAVLHPGWGRVLRVGAGIGLATAAKYTGAALALPITLATAAYRGKERRAWLGLVAAGGLSFAVFAVLNPHLGRVVRFTGRLSRIYAENAQPLEGGRLGVLAAEVETLLANHGLGIGTAALAGLLLLAVSAMRAWRRGEAASTVQAGRQMLLVWVVGFSLLYAAVTELPKANNYLPLFPFTALAAAWVLVEAWRALAGRLPVLRRPVVPALALIPLVLALGWPLQTWVIHTVVPATHTLAEDRLARRLDDVGTRMVVWERSAAERRAAAARAPEPEEDEGGEDDDRRRPEVLVRQGRPRAAVAVVDRLAELTPEALGLADAVVFPAARLDGPDASFYLDLLLRVPEAGRETVGGEGELSRGGARVVLLHPWRRTGAPRALEPRPVPGEPGAFEAALPAAAGGAGAGPEAGPTVSLRLVLPAGAGVPQLEAGGRELPLYRQRGSRRTRWYLTARFRPREGAAVRLSGLPPELTAREVGMEAIGWAAPEGRP